MKDFLAQNYQKLLGAHGLDNFDGLWNLQLETVDAPNTERGGWSSVCRLELEAEGEMFAFYLKRQCNHRSLSWQRPFGEPTFARELRNINAYADAGVAALEAAFFAERSSRDGRQAILLTVALDDYQPLSDVVLKWNDYDANQRKQWSSAIGHGVAQLHNAHLTHHCLYPKHVYLPRDSEVSPLSVRFIDLEKTRYQLLVWRDRVADIEALLRRCNMWTNDERNTLLESYLSHLNRSKSLAEIQSLMLKRQTNKAARP